jgi:hypothetical protein
MPRGARKIPNRQVMRPPVPTVGASQLPPLVPPAPPRRPKRRSPKPGLGIPKDAPLNAPIPRHTVLAGRQYRAPEAEAAAMIGGAPITTKPSSQIESPLAAQLGIATPIRKVPQ